LAPTSSRLVGEAEADAEQRVAEDGHGYGGGAATDRGAGEACGTAKDQAAPLRIN